MTKEDALQIANAKSFLIPLQQYRNQLKMKPDVNKIESFPENSEVHIETLQLRIEQQKQEEQLSRQLMKNSLENMLETRRKK
jgi:hypothetical protein